MKPDSTALVRMKDTPFEAMLTGLLRAEIKNARALGLDKLGYPIRVREWVRLHLRLPHGLCLPIGPVVGTAYLAMGRGHIAVPIVR